MSLNKEKLTYDEAFKNAKDYFKGDDLAASVFISKYAISDDNGNYLESTPEEMHMRMAKEYARIEEKMGGENQLSEEEIFNLFKDWTIIPGGSVMNGLGNPNYIGSLSNCFVAPSPQDSYSSIMKNREILVQLMKRRGGVGIDISHLRPSGAKVNNAAKSSTGAVSFMNVYSELTKEVALNGRRGALMISISGKHPDVDEFIKVKQDLTKITGANISVKFDNEFMNAVVNNGEYIQRFPINTSLDGVNIDELPLNKKVFVGEKCFKKVKAKDIWNLFVECSWKTAEPGIMYEDMHYDYSPDSVYDEYKGITTNPCVAGDTIINTDKGKLTIKEVVERFNSGEKFKVLSYNIEDNKPELKPITKALLTKKDAKLIEIKINKDVKLKLTPEHKVYTSNRGYVEASSLTKDDLLIICFSELKNTYQELYKDIEITSIEEVKNEDVYDISVEKNHNFFANNILVHNCGEIFMDPNNSCRLMHINLANFVKNPFTDKAYFDYDELEKVAGYNMRLCDDLVELELEYVSKIIDKIKSNYTEENETELQLWEEIRQKGENSRRAGCGATGLADAIAMMGMKLDEDETLEVIDYIFKYKMLGELKMQIQLAKERGTFKGFDFSKEFIYNTHDKLYDGKNKFYDFIAIQYQDLIEDIKKYGRRNVSWGTMAPVGSVSILTQTTSGIEPLFSPFYKRRKKISSSNGRVDFVDNTGEKFTEYFVIHEPFKKWIKINSENEINFNNITEEELQKWFEKSPWGGSTAPELSPITHLNMQSIVQYYISHSISKTINLPENATIEEISDLFIEGWKRNLKGVTIYRDNCRAGVMVKSDSKCGCETQLIHNAPKRPKVMKCDIKRFRNGGEKWVAAIGLMDGKPYEIFTGLSEKLNIPEYVTEAEIIKNKINKIVEDEDTGEMVEKKVSRYDIKYINNNGEKVIIEGLSNIFNPIFYNYSKLISGLLRHGMGVQYIIATIKSMDFKDNNINSWKNGVIRSLKTYIEDGEIKGEVCPTCKGKITRINGCKTCTNCGWSACG